MAGKCKWQLTPKALSKISKRPIRIKLATELNVGERSVFSYISKNHPNLTRYGALLVICKETGLKMNQVVEMA